MNDWKLCYDDFDPHDEGLREALCTLGNGYFATRGAAEESEAGEFHYPGTYLAGGYNRLTTDLAGRSIENEDLVNLPNWLPLTFRPEGGDWLNLLATEILSYRQELDMQHGLLRRMMRVKDRQGRITAIETTRLVHMHEPHLAAIAWEIRPENWSGEVTIRSALDGRVVNSGVERYRQLASRHFSTLTAEQVGEESIALLAETSRSHLRIAQVARTRAFAGSQPLRIERSLVAEPDFIAQDLVVALTADQPLRVEKVVAMYSSRDRAISDPLGAACICIAGAGDFAELLESHKRAWSQLWWHGDLVLKARHRTQMILRLHIFHLLQTVSPHTGDLDVGVPARGLHGEAYRGHIFWDELFIFPFLTLRLPQITRALLLYRYRRLPEARRLARAAGFCGAMYPWQSGSTGREETQVVHLNPKSGRWLSDNSQLQRHVNAAIAYNVWRYYDATRDEEFLNFHGAEMLCEIARFWASIARWNPKRERYDIRGVMGPDEFHDAYPEAEQAGLDNNAYTNVMASWVLQRALTALDRVEPVRRSQLCETLSLGDTELEAWDEISRKLFVPFHDGIPSQFEGYEHLEEFDWEGYREKYGDIHRLDRILEAEGDSVNRYKASKQADVLMLFYLFSIEELHEQLERLGYSIDDDTVSRTVDYYRQRTSDGSTLSRVVHSWVLARIDRSQSWTLLREALESDVADTQGGTTAEGIHLGAMAGTVDLVQRGQTGLEIREAFFRLDPHLSEDMQDLSLRLRYRGHWLELEFGCETLTMTAPDGWSGPESIMIGNDTFAFGAGAKLDLQCRDGSWSSVE
ncbi:glycoside hydrolase family 65 protein [Aurantiacibacter hainanensis]|uniref:glycoside hydrolase family 65 protein n=1 Tax=Aurantiacibacter hainanensis TaxID=3076114 RepID=UPI0030C73C73